MGCTSYLTYIISLDLHFPGGRMVKNPPVNAGKVGSVSGLGRFCGERNGHPLLYSCLENPTDRGAWCATFLSVTKEPNTTKHAHAHI